MSGRDIERNHIFTILSDEPHTMYVKRNNLERDEEGNETKGHTVPPFKKCSKYNSYKTALQNRIRLEIHDPLGIPDIKQVKLFTKWRLTIKDPILTDQIFPKPIL